jgi:tellurite resistance protein
MSAATKPPKIAELEKHAETVRKDLVVPKQADVFAVAVEAGYLAALADGEVDAGERAALVRAVEVLSIGAVIEWEAEALVEECAGRVKADGAEKRAEAVGAKLSELGAPDAGLLFAAFVAEATGGIDAKEKRVLEQIAKAASVDPKRLGAILGKAQGKKK